MSSPLVFRPRALEQRGYGLGEFWRHPLALLGLAQVLLVLVYLDTVQETVTFWLRHPAYQVAFLVIPTMCYLLWHNYRHYAWQQAASSYLAIAGALVAALVWMAGNLLDILLLRQVGLLLGMYLVVAAGLGLRMTLALAPLLALGIFMVPLGDVLFGQHVDLVVV